MRGDTGHYAEVLDAQFIGPPLCAQVSAHASQLEPQPPPQPLPVATTAGAGATAAAGGAAGAGSAPANQADVSMMNAAFTIEPPIGGCSARVLGSSRGTT